MAKKPESPENKIVNRAECNVWLCMDSVSIQFKGTSLLSKLQMLKALLLEKIMVFKTNKVNIKHE